MAFYDFTAKKRDGEDFDFHALEGKPLPTLDENTVFLGVPAKAASFASDDVPLDAAAICAELFQGKHIGLEETAPAGTKTAVVFLNRHPDNGKAVQAACRLAGEGIQTVTVNMSVPLYAAFCLEP